MSSQLLNPFGLSIVPACSCFMLIAAATILQAFTALAKPSGSAVSLTGQISKNYSDESSITLKHLIQRTSLQSLLSHWQRMELMIGPRDFFKEDYLKLFKSYRTAMN